LIRKNTHFNSLKTQKSELALVMNVKLN